MAALKEIKEVKRARLTEYKKYRPNSEYHEGRGVWSVKCDVALPCATQNELLLDDAKALVANGVHRCGRGRKHADHPGGDTVSSGERRSVCTGQGQPTQAA